MRKVAPPIVVLDNEFATLRFYPKTRILHHTIHKFMTGGSYRDLLTAGLRYVEEEGATKWLSDNSASPVVSKENDQWRARVFMPRAIRAGFRFWAVVMPVKPIGKMQVRAWIEEFEKAGITLQVFDDVDPALKWLEEAS